MPELPEVETIRLGLQKYLVGHVIESIDIRLPKMVSGEAKRVKDTKVQAIRRYGKGLVIDFANNYSIAIHIKMTGQLIYQGPRSSLRPVPSGTGLRSSGQAKVSREKVGNLPGPHTHVIFRLNNNSFLYYNDIRQFGWIKIVPTNDVSSLPFFKDLGPEPLSNLTIDQFSSIVKAVKSPIKPLLMDQKKIAGIGNIYANEALYLAKIHPKRQPSSLSDPEIKTLFDAIENVLKKALETGGSSEWQYVNALGQEGSYQKIFQIYGQVGKKCKICGATIQKITLGGRGTFFCPACQRLA